MSRPPTLQAGYGNGRNDFGKQSLDAPILKFKDVFFHSLEYAKAIRLIQLSKWLEPSHEEMDFIRKEHLRISSDYKRTSLPVYHEMKIALFVNDITDGKFESLQDEL